MLRDNLYGALTAAAEALITAWWRVTPQEVGMYASMARGHHRKALEEFARNFVVRHRALPTGKHTISGRAVDFDALTWKGGR